MLESNQLVFIDAVTILHRILLIAYLTHIRHNLVPQYGIEPHFDAYKATVIPLYYKGNWWRIAESNR